MSKDILILNSSPRMTGNTAILCDAFTKGAQEDGHTVTRFDLQNMVIHGCLGCMKGGKDSESPCVQKDDMGIINTALVGFLGWHDLGRVLAGGVLQAGAVSGKPVVEEANRFGASL